MSNNSFLLSICITSYKRVKELERCLKSIDTFQNSKIEVIVSEDCSPQRELIREVVNHYAKVSSYKVIFNTNEHNLGYDRNLKKLVTLASGEYVMYLSDDDCLFPGKLDEFLESLERNRPAMAYTSFLYGYKEKKYPRRKYSSSHIISAGVCYEGKRVYDSILFSGLTFRRDYLLEIEAERFVNLNYIQVYMFLTVLYHHGGYYQDTLLIDSVSDGENAYGQVESTGKDNEFLANRESVFSNIEFNKGLFKAIKMFDEENQTNVFQNFSKEFSLRSLGGMLRARRLGVKTYNEYWIKLKNTDVILSPVSYFYYYVTLILGDKASRLLFTLPKNLLLLLRQ